MSANKKHEEYSVLIAVHRDTTTTKKQIYSSLNNGLEIDSMLYPAVYVFPSYTSLMTSPLIVTVTAIEVTVSVPEI
jgi:hypothetical protein